MEVAFLDRLASAPCPARGSSGRWSHSITVPPPYSPLRDGALEVAVVERMVLGPHRQALVVGIEARPLGHRPALEHAVQLEPEVPVQPGRVVLLDDEAVALARPFLPVGSAVFVKSRFLL